jgi:hypothetical protein
LLMAGEPDSAAVRIAASVPHPDAPAASTHPLKPRKAHAA